MKGVAYSRHGEPWDVVTVVDLPEPQLSPGQVLVALEAAPIHIADLLAMRATLPFFPVPPGVGGFEGVGRITAIAEDVDDWRVGERVFLPIGYGAWQAHHVVDVAALIKAPEGVPAEQLALAPINLTTAYLLLHAYDRLEDGDWVIQNGANSNVGTYVDVFARRAGINMVHVVRRPALVEILKGEGRAHVLVDGPNLAEEVAAITQSRPKMAFDVIGGEATARLGACVADHGLVLSYGFLSKAPHQLAYPDLVFRGVRLRGVLTNWAMDRLDETSLTQMRGALDDVMTSSELTAQIAAIYPFSKAADALRHAAKTGADRQGKVILVPD